MKALRARLAALSAAIDQRARRERVLLIVASLVVLVLLWFQFVFQPLGDRHQAAGEAVSEAEQALRTARQRERELEIRLAEDPDESIREEISELEEELESLQERISGRMPAFIEPDRMREVLAGVLADHDGVSLVRARRLPAERVIEPDEDSDGVYRHGLELTVETDYRAAMEYLRAVEGLRWQFTWDRLEYEVVEHPTARVTVRLYTFSGQSAWLGV